MTAYERVKIECELKEFTVKNFEKPSECRNLDQIRFYANELCLKIEAYENRFSSAPAWVYAPLEQYTAKQNLMTELSRKTMCS